MNEIVLNGETLEIGKKYDTIVIEGFDHTFANDKVESGLLIEPTYGEKPEPGPSSDKPYYPTNYIFPSIIYKDEIDIDISAEIIIEG